LKAQPWYRAATAALIGSAVSLAAQSSPQDYPQWRGQQRDGAASAFTAPKSWPDALTRKWKIELGEGYATPLVIGNTVYCFTRRGGDEVMTALDANTGRETWQSGYAAPYTPAAPTAAHGAGPKATPAFHDGRLFTLGVSGIMAAFDAANGKLLWRTAAPVEPPFFSAASSPVVDGGTVLAHPGSYGPLTAFDVRSGEVKWTAGEGGFFASPLVATLAGTRQVITVTQQSVIGVSIADGTVLWRYPWPGGEGGTMPVLYGDIVIVGGLNAGAAAFTPKRSDGKWIAEPAWTTTDVSLYVSNPVIVGDTLFGLSRRASGQFFGLDAKTGKVLWLGPPREAANSALVKAGELLFLLNDDAELIVARSSRTGFEPVKRYTVADSATWAQPTISGNRVFIKDVSSLALWTFD
jgi:outer membrane protein assembly factor BamB